MTFKCSICKDSFLITREQFPILSKPAICNRCAEVIWEAYLEVYRIIKERRKDTFEQVSQHILFSTLDDETKAFMMEVLKAYCTTDETDGHSSEIRAIMDAIFSDECSAATIRSWIALGNFNEREKGFLSSFLDKEDDRITEIMALIDENEEENKDDEAELFGDEYDEFMNNEESEVCNEEPRISEPVVDVPTEKRSVLSPIEGNRNMQDIISEVLKAIKCQDYGVIQIGRLIYRHLMRLLYNDKHPDEPLRTKQNILVIGPTGVGKTATIQEYCRILSIPCVEVDMTNITQTGYVGDSLVDSFRRLVGLANGNIGWAQKGIMILDEGDKNMKSGVGTEQNPGGKTVMFELLKKLEGGDIALGGGKFFNTKDLLFICMGTFESAYEARKERVGGKRTVGFGDKETEKVTTQPSRFIAEDLIKGGAPAEWVGRFPNIIEFTKLNADEYVTVLNSSNKSVFLENKKLLEYAYDGLELIITPEGERKIAEQAVKYDVGVRGLNRIMTELLEEVEGKLVMKEGNYKKVVIGESVTYE